MKLMFVIHDLFSDLCLCGDLKYGFRNPPAAGRNDVVRLLRLLECGISGVRQTPPNLPFTLPSGRQVRGGITLSVCKRSGNACNVAFAK